MKRNYTPALCVLLGATMWGFIGIFVNHLPGASAFELLAARSAVSALGLFIYIVITNRALLKINIRDIWLFIGTGIISFGAYTVFYTAAIRLTSMSTAVVLLYTSPIFATILSALFFKERITAQKAAAVALAFLGCALICGFTKSPVLGIVSGILSGFCYALYSIFGAAAVKKYDSLTVTFYTFVFAFLFSVPFVMRGGAWDFPVSGKTAAWLLAYAFVCGLLPYLLYTYGLSKMPPAEAAVIACIEPVAATLLGTFVLKESITVTQGLGIASVLLAVLILQKRQQKKSG